MENTFDNLFSTPAVAPPEVVEFLRLVGQLIGTASVYTFEHKMVQQALDEATTAIGPLLVKREKMTLTAMDGELLADSLPVTTRNPLIAGLTTKMENCRIDNLAFHHGAGREDLARLAHVLGMPSAKIKAALQELRNPASLIRIDTSSYRRVEENEVVLKKEDLAGLTADGLASVPAASLEHGEAGPRAEPPAPPPPPAPPSPEAAAARLAELILKEAGLFPEGQATPATAEMRCGAVIDSLRRQGQELLDGPAVNTQQGRKELAKLLVRLEAELQERLRGAGLSDTALTTVTETLRDLQQNVAVDALAAEYLKKRQALKTAEGRVMRFLKRTAGHEAAAALQERLLAEGLEEEAVRELAAASGAAAPDSREDSGARGGVSGNVSLLRQLSHLELLLTPHPLEVHRPEETRAELKTAVVAVTAELAAMAERIEGKLARLTALAEELRGAGQATGPAKRKRDAHHNLFAVLAEIIQELMQPLCVITCAVDMLLGNRLGEMPAEQADLLRLIADGNSRLRQLADKLHAICGNPASRVPDRKILDYVYDRPATAAPDA